MKWRVSMLALALLTGCASQKDDLADHQELWSKQAPAAYQYTFETRGFLPHVKLQVTVRSGAVTSSVSLDPALPAAAGQTVEELFTNVGQRLDAANCDTKVSYDETFGYPLSVYSDCGMEGDGWTVSDFAVLP